MAGRRARSCSGRGSAGGRGMGGPPRGAERPGERGGGEGPLPGLWKRARRVTSPPLAGAAAPGRPRRSPRGQGSAWARLNAE